MGLLDILAEKMNCTYLSDLRFLPPPNAALRQAVASMPLDDFSEYEWKDAAEYLCGVSCASAKEAWDTILKRI
jgi:hypothetical protein